MKPIAGTLPEPKMQSTNKKRAPQAAATLPTAHEREVKVKQEKVKAKKSGSFIGTWWPLLVAVFISGFAPEWHAMAVSAGIWALRFTFPYAMLVTHSEIGIDAQMGAILPSLAIYLQIPIDGVYLSLTLARGKSLMSGIIQVLLIHGVCTLVLWLLTYL
jgi:hypothetical protein